ncbi:hypothetical protein LCER1_G001130 [Lachnellula cervina]|uniref:Alpha-L-rhamnosidase C n=1 Tax=Lachnellula cervina TaxID=1316786 RepID=A0A7D8ZBV9_9HELO|nr:hypothetical protein LCER1_G001130 [Lachnellula cervina]
MAFSPTAPATGASVQNDGPEPFPPPSPTSTPPAPRRTNTDTEESGNRSRGQSSTSSLSGRLRSASKTFQESNPPTGFMIATGTIASSLPSVSDIRRGSYGSEGWSGEGQVREKERRASITRQGSQSDMLRHKSSGTLNRPREPSSGFQTVPEAVDESEAQMHGVMAPDEPLDTSEEILEKAKVAEMEISKGKMKGVDQRSSSDTNVSPKSTSVKTNAEFKTTPFENGYQFPPKHTWQKSTIIGLKAFWGFFLTPIGFLVTVYGLNVVAWGGMLFLLLCNASPAMCKPTCNDINSPRRIWIEIDSQILNSLFCVTGFGTIPWRFRDLYYLLQYRIQKKEIGLRRLAGINRGWFRLAGSEKLPVELGPANVVTEAPNFPESSLAFPIIKISDAPLTGIRAPPTKMWKLDFVVWTMVINTFLQAVLSGFMWGLNRYKRPSWSTGLFVALACIVAAMGGIMSFIEAKHVKAIEGVPVSEEDQERLKRDRELGIQHYNNINDEKPKEHKVKVEKEGHSKRKHNKDESVMLVESAMKEGAGQIAR